MRRLLSIAFVAAAALAAGLVARRRRQRTRWKALPPPDEADSPPGLAAASPAPAGSRDREPTRKELYREATRLGLKGRSKMNKRQLQEAVEAARTGGDS